MSLADSLEQAAGALPDLADAIRPANGDPERLLEELSAESGARLVVWLLTHAPDDADELARAWSESEAGREPLSAVDEDELPKAGRKVWRRLRHRLRASGHGAALAAATTETRVARVRAGEDRLELAFVTHLDPSGARAVYLAEPHPAGGARLFEALLDDARGVVDFEVYKAGRSQVRRFLRELQQRARLRSVPVEPDVARALVARAAAAQPAERPWPRSFAEWRSRLGGSPDPARLPSALVRAALEAPDPAPGVLSRVAARVRAGELGPWPPERPQLSAAVERLKSGAESPLVLTPEQRRERLHDAIAASADEIYRDAQAELTAGRLEETAFVCWRLGEEEIARDCLAAARAFRELPPVENAVALAMLEVALAPALESLLREAREAAGASESASEGPPEEEQPLLVEP